MHRHHKLQSIGSIPFSWEDQPGLSKITKTPPDHFSYVPPPRRPSKVDGRGARMLAADGLHLPLPPCMVHPTLRSSSRKGWKKEEDPFLAAYLECTSGAGSRGRSSAGARERSIEGLLGLLSCKGGAATGVEENAMVRQS